MSVCSVNRRCSLLFTSSTVSLPRSSLCPPLCLEAHPGGFPTSFQPICTGCSGDPTPLWNIFHPLGTAQRPQPSFGSIHGHQASTSVLLSLFLAPSFLIFSIFFSLLAPNAVQLGFLPGQPHFWLLPCGARSHLFLRPFSTRPGYSAGHLFFGSSRTPLSLPCRNSHGGLPYSLPYPGPKNPACD